MLTNHVGGGLRMRLQKWLLAAVLALGVGGSAAAAEFASTVPTARVDYWQKREADITAMLADTKDLSAVKLVFLGDSITDFWHLGENPWFKGLYCGRAVWDESFGGAVPANNAINLGVSGDRIEHVLFRLLPASAGGKGELDRADLNPDFVVLMLGINNSFDVENPAVDSIFAGVKTVVEAVHARKPGTRILLQSLLPTNDPVKNRDLVQPINAKLAALAKSPPFNTYVVWLDLYPAFVDTAGLQQTKLFNDGLHPSEAGYRVWRDRLVPALAAAR